MRSIATFFGLAFVFGMLMRMTDAGGEATAADWLAVALIVIGAVGGIGLIVRSIVTEGT
jgi:hypothetical protein